MGTVVVICGLLVVLDPSEKQHKNAMTKAIITYTHPASPMLDPGEQGMVDRLVYHDYIIFSTTTDPTAEELFITTPETVGFCGKVVIRMHFPNQK